MNLPKFLSKSIGRTQAITVLLASLAISLLLSVVQLTYTYKAQKGAELELRDEILNLAEGGATTASWTLDAKLADEVIQSVIAIGDVQTATLRDESGVVLSFAEKPVTEYGRTSEFVARHLLDGTIRGRRTLTVSAGDVVQPVGSFSITMDSRDVAKRFVDVATTIIVASFFQALAIGLVLFWLGTRLVTQPLKLAAREISQIDPENPTETVIEIPARHEHNELGYLLSHTSKMLKRLSSVQQQLKTLATHDPLTNLPNRNFVVSRLERAIGRADRNKSMVATLFLDLDEFKTVNDSHGHTEGDLLLSQVAMRLSKILRSNDSIGRIGGDEFLIVVEDIQCVEDVFPTIQRIESQFNAPFFVGKSEVFVKCSIGVANFPSDGHNASELMRNADMAMYQAKGNHTARHMFYSKAISVRIQERKDTEIALRKALKNNEFELYYQPKVHARTNRIIGCEALLRWHRQGEIVPAADFIGIAEKSGLMSEIGKQVLQMACLQAKKWARLHSPIPIAVNISAQQLKEDDFVQRVLETIDQYKVNATLIEFEITETILMKELDHAVEKLNKLREQGFAVSIDDFGTGYSSLSYLTHLPATALKIDRSFVSGSKNSEVVLDMIIAMAKALKLTTIAEGIETEAQRDNLLSKNCDVLQGYMLGKPMHATEFEQRFAQPAA